MNTFGISIYLLLVQQKQKNAPFYASLFDIYRMSNLQSYICK